MDESLRVAGEVFGGFVRLPDLSRRLANQVQGREPVVLRDRLAAAPVGRPGVPLRRAEGRAGALDGAGQAPVRSGGRPNELRLACGIVGTAHEDDAGFGAGANFRPVLAACSLCASAPDS